MERRLWLTLLITMCLFAGSTGRGLEIKQKDNSPLYNHTLATILVEYASAVYMSDLTQLFTWTCSRCDGMTTGFEVLELIVDVENCLQAFVGVADDLNAIIIAFRGTQETSVQNWIEDLFWKQLDFEYPGCTDGKVHHGFFNAYNNTIVRSGILDGVSRAKKVYGDIKIMVTGHSMGGAMAAFCGLDLSLIYGKDNVQVMTFGQPRIGNAAFASYYSEIVPNTFRITHEHDLVPHLPPYYQHLPHKTYHHFPREVWLYSMGFGFLIYEVEKICDGSGEDPDCSRSVTGNSITDHLSYFGVEMGCDESSNCKIVMAPSLASYGKVDEFGNFALSRVPSKFILKSKTEETTLHLSYERTLTETLETRIYSAMGDEEVMGSASPAPSDHKRKLDELDSEPFEQQPASAEANGNSQSPDGDGDGDGDGEGDGDAASNEDPDVKRPRLEDNSDGSEGTENGHQEETVEEEKEDITEHSDSMKNTELEENEEKSDEPLDRVNQESLNDEPQANSMEPQAAENPLESPKEDNQEYGADYQDPTPDAGLQEDESDLKEQSTSSDQLTSRRMEVPSNKVGVLIGKGGDTIRTLQYSSGARIQITRDSEADPDALTRNVELIGSLENINKAERLIKDVIAEAEAGGSPSLVARGFSAHSSGGFGEQVHIQVPNEKVGVIIGKGGETIKNLQTRSGARIQLIPQHLPEGDQSRERTVRVTGDRKQIETAKDLIKEVMDQPTRSSTPSGQHNMRSRGSNNWGGSRSGGHHSHQSGYNNNNNYPPQRGGGGGGPYSSQNSQYSSPGYGNYPPQQPPAKNNYGWEQRPQPNIPDQTGYDYYSGGHPPPPMHSHTPGNPPPYNYGPPQDYSQQPPPSYPQTAPQGYGQGYGQQHSYGGQGTQPSAYPQNPGYGQQQDQYGKPMAYNMPHQQGPYYGPPRQQPYSAGPMQQQQQGYPQYATTAPVNDGYSHPGGGGGGYGQPVSGYGQQAAPGYAPPASGYGQYPSTQPGYGEQNSGGYGYQGAGDQGYGGGPGMGYGAPPPVQPAAYSQPAPAQVPAPAPAPVQPGYDHSGGYAAPQPQPQPQAQAGYGQYDNSQMYR